MVKTDFESDLDMINNKKDMPEAAPRCFHAMEESPMKWCIATAVAISLALATGASAQDDFDWDGLLGDEEPVAEAAAEDAPAVEAAADDFADFADDTAAVAEDVADGFADFADDAADSLADASDDAADAFADVADDTADAFADAADDTADAFADVADDTADAFSDAADDVADVAEDAADDFSGMDDLFADAADEAPAAAPAPALDDDMFGGFDDVAAAPSFDEPAAEPAADDDFAPYAADDSADDGFADDEAVAAPAKKAGSRYSERISPKEAKKLAKEVSHAEEVRRQAAEDEANRLAADGMRALDANKPGQAENLLKQALDQMPVRDETAAERARITSALADAKFLRAKALYDTRDDAVLADAREIVDSGLEIAPDHRGLRALDSQLAKREAAAVAYKPPAKRSEVISEKLDIRDLYIEARQWYAIKDYDRAGSLFEQILARDPYHKSALRYLRKIEKDRYKIATLEADARRNGMLTQVRKSWSPPMRVALDIPKETTDRESRSTKPASQAVLEKMRDIVIPKLEFRQANIADVVNYLVEASIAADPAGEGVNIILNLGDGGAVPSAPAPAPAADDGWGDFDGDDFAAPAPAAGGSSGVPPITLNLRNVSMSDAINFITEVARLKYRVENTAVIITSKDAPVGNIITRMYPVQPSFQDVVVQRQEMSADDRDRDFVGLGGNVTMQKSEVKEFFEKAGVPFPTGASITYNSAISQLIVANTAENLETFEKILQQINVIPNQVEIEARFIEVNQNDLEELGLQWILNDNWEIATKRDGSGGRIQMNSGNITAGLRGYGYNSSSGMIEPVNRLTQTSTQTLLGPIASFSSVLTNPELSVVLNAISQKGGSDLLSAPRVTTRSGVNAQIQVVKEIIYPTEFDLTQPTVNSDGDVTMAPIVTPGSFETRATGVILNVTPTVGADGYTIDLVMAPEVAELVDWIQYGSVITVVNESYQFNMPMPVFTSRNVATSLVIWDGQTVVMGGLIREEVSTIKDKIPILGDIPLLGRLFRNEGSWSQKKNLLIFVTARLVDPAGRPVHDSNAVMPGAGVETASAPEP
jgi:general secretion pathway protein D